jgi:hypothetical protein
MQTQGTHLQLKVGVYEQWKYSPLGTHERLLTWGVEAHNTDAVLTTVFVKQLPIPLVHLQVLVKVLKHNHSILSFVEVCQYWQ